MISQGRVAIDGKTVPGSAGAWSGVSALRLPHALGPDAGPRVGYAAANVTSNPTALPIMARSLSASAAR